MTREIRLLSILSGISKEEKVPKDQFGKGHKDIMRLYDAIDMPRQLYLVLESVEGSILNEILR